MQNWLATTIWQLDETRFKAFVKTLGVQRRGVWVWRDWAPQHIYVLRKMTTSELLSIPVWTFGKSPHCCEIPIVQSMFIAALIFGPANSCELAIWAWWPLCGVTIGQSRLNFIPSHASIVSLLTGVDRSLALFVCCSSIGRMSAASNVYPILSKIGCSTADSWADGGCWITACGTMISILMNGPPNLLSHHLSGALVCMYPETKGNPPPRDRIPQSEQLPSHIGSTQVSKTSATEGSPIPTEPKSESTSHPTIGAGDDEWELVDEEIVFADCHGVVEADILTPNNPVTFADLDSANPLVQIGPAVFEGRYEDVLGTVVFIEPRAREEDGSVLAELRTPLGPPSSARLSQPSVQLVKSTKCLVLDRVFLKPKLDSQSSEQN